MQMVIYLVPHITSEEGLTGDRRGAGAGAGGGAVGAGSASHAENYNWIEERLWKLLEEYSKALEKEAADEQ